MSGDIDIFWEDGDTGETIVEADVPVGCAARARACAWG